MVMACDDDLLLAFELHSVERLSALLDAGLDPEAPVRGKIPLQWLTEMYTRNERMPELVRALLDRGAVLDDPAIAPVLLDDADALAAAVRASPSRLEHRTTTA
jgi:hypothetical protein